MELHVSGLVVSHMLICKVVHFFLHNFYNLEVQIFAQPLNAFLKTLSFCGRLFENHLLDSEEQVEFK